MGDVDVAFPALFAGLAVAGAAVRIWWFALVPLALWPVVYAGMHEGWWLDGLGDGWTAAALGVTISSFAVTVTAIAVGRAIDESVRGRRRTLGS